MTTRMLRVSSRRLLREESLPDMKLHRLVALFALVPMLALTVSFASEQATTDTTPPKEGLLTPAEVGGKLLPDKVFFKGQSASVQARNSAGVRYHDGSLVIAALVDASGYASAIREKYQGYLIAEVPIEIGGQTLKPGIYGFGFIEGSKFVVMDVGANDLLQASSTKDTDMKRPVPFQFVQGPNADTYRLYKGRDYVEFKRK
jgi:hypothetical protein